MTTLWGGEHKMDTAHWERSFLHISFETGNRGDGKALFWNKDLRKVCLILKYYLWSTTTTQNTTSPQSQLPEESSSQHLLCKSLMELHVSIRSPLDHLTLSSYANPFLPQLNTGNLSENTVLPMTGNWVPKQAVGSPTVLNVPDFDAAILGAGVDVAIVLWECSTDHPFKECALFGWEEQKVSVYSPELNNNLPQW